MAGWMELFEAIERCDRCPLRGTCQSVVPGEGSPDAQLMLIGEGPGADEDRLGRPFVGASGQLLTGILEAIELERRSVYIANVVKCRPPANRTPTAEEACACLPYLRRQVSLVRPKVIVLLGATAAKYTIGEDVRIRRDHGKWTQRAGVWMMPTYHPSALLREPAQKLDAWADFQRVKEKLREIQP
ncbi:MAG: uracil-DNA glycosylase [Clostridia bacterium]